MGHVAVIIVDMLKDNVEVPPPVGIGEEGRRIIPQIKRLLQEARRRGLFIVFANDSFLPEDFIFQGTRMKPHCLAGTEGARVISELEPQNSDLVLPKRRFSAFLGTGLDKLLRGRGVDTIAVAGISTPVCVLTTVLDGICYDFKTILLEDCCAAYRREAHEAVVNLYRRTAMYPLLQVMPLDQFLSSL